MRELHEENTTSEYENMGISSAEILKDGSEFSPARAREVEYRIERRLNDAQSDSSVVQDLVMMLFTAGSHSSQFQAQGQEFGRLSGRVPCNDSSCELDEHELRHFVQSLAQDGIQLPRGGSRSSSAILSRLYPGNWLHSPLCIRESRRPPGLISAMT